MVDKCEVYLMVDYGDGKLARARVCSNTRDLVNMPPDGLRARIILAVAQTENELAKLLEDE